MTYYNIMFEWKKSEATMQMSKNVDTTSCTASIVSLLRQWCTVQQSSFLHLRHHVKFRPRSSILCIYTYTWDYMGIPCKGSDGQAIKHLKPTWIQGHTSNFIIYVCSIDWFKAKITGHSHISSENLWFPVQIFPFLSTHWCAPCTTGSGGCRSRTRTSDVAVWLNIKVEVWIE